MRVLVTGAAGMIGRKLTAQLVARGALGGREIDALDLHDVVPTPVPEGQAIRTESHLGDLSDGRVCASLIARRPDVLFHLAAVVSGEAEQDFEKGYRVNLDGTRALFDAIRLTEGYTPRLVFTSSDAVYGTPFPDVILDEFQQAPLSSYGVQKLIGELLLTDYTRRGFLDGIGIRFPTICVRPGKPNKAASGFFSNIIREPLVGLEAVLPVPDSVTLTCASPRAAIGYLIHAAELESERIGPQRNMSMPGVVVSVAEQIEALRRLAGEDAVRRIRREPDEAIWSLVQDWPSRFDASRAKGLGFKPEDSFDEIIQAHIADELNGAVAH